MNICDESQFLSLNFDIRVYLNEFMEKSFQLTFYLRLIAGMITKRGTNLENICLLSSKPSTDLEILDDNDKIMIFILSVSLVTECWTRTFQLQTVKLLLDQILPERC